MTRGAVNPAATLLRRELLRDGGWIARAAVATAIVNGLAVATSLFAMQVYDRVVPTLAWATLTTLTAGMGLVVALDWTLRTLRARILDSAASAIDKRLSQRVFEHLLHLRLDARPRALGTLAAQVNALDAVRQFFASGIVFALVDVPFALLFVAVIGLVGGTVAWVYGALVLVAVAVGLVGQARGRRLAALGQRRAAERHGLLVDAIRAAESVRATGAAPRFAAEWEALTRATSGHAIRQRAITTFSGVTVHALSTSAYVAATVVGVWRIEAGLMTVGALIACSVLGGRVIGPVSQAAQYLAQWQGVSEALDQVGRFLSLERERREGQALLAPESPPRSLALERVRFGYAGATAPELDVPSLELVAGDRALLIGPVGCGKSTLLKVMAGLYRPAEGRVRLGDADLWETDPAVVAARVGYLPQAVHLFRGTLRENLAPAGAPGDAALLDAGREFGVDAIAAASPLGMDRPIAEGGDGLSGGQRQLVGLARTALAAPTVWLLDEPTASLDARTEARAWHALERRLGPEDILVVATHRPGRALELASRVIVMRAGGVAMDGSPAEVLGGPLVRTRPPGRSAADAGRLDDAA